MRRIYLHLTTRCGCTRIVDNGVNPPPPEYVVALERSRRAPVPMVQALSLAGVDPRTVEEIEEERMREPQHRERTFARTGYSGTAESGTAFYKEI